MKTPMLKKERLLLHAWTDNGVIKIKRELTRKSIKVKHLSTLYEMFPNFKFQSKSSYS